MFERLTGYLDLDIVVLGVPDDRDRSDGLLAYWQGPHLNTCGRAARQCSTDGTGSPVSG